MPYNRARRSNPVTDFFENFSSAYDAVGGFARDLDLQKVGSAKATTDTGFTQEQGDQLNAAANSGQYDVAWDAGRNQYTVRPKASPEMEGAVAPQQRTQFLGKTYDTPLDDAGVSRERRMAMAGVLEKHGDTMGGSKLRDQVQQGDVANERLKVERERADRERQVAPLQMRELERADRRGAAAEADSDTTRQIDTQVGDWFKQRLTDPASGAQRAPSMKDHLDAGAYRATVLAQAGRYDLAGKTMDEHNARALAKIAQETAQRNQAVNSVKASVGMGNLSPVLSLYNDFVPDGATATAIKRGPKGSIIIERVGADGQALPPHTFENDAKLMAGIEEMRTPGAVAQFARDSFDQEMRRRAAAQGDAQVAISRANSQSSIALHGAQLEEVKQRTSDKKELGDIHVALNAAIDAGDQNAAGVARQKLMTYTLQGKGAQNMSAEEKRANFYLASGAAKDLASAAAMAHEKTQTSPKDDYLKFTTLPMPLREVELASAMETLHGKNWKDKVQGRNGGAEPPSFPSEAAAGAAEKAGKLKKGTVVIINGQRGTWQ